MINLVDKNYLLQRVDIIEEMVKKSTIIRSPLENCYDAILKNAQWESFKFSPMLDVDKNATFPNVEQSLLGIVAQSMVSIPKVSPAFVDFSWVGYIANIEPLLDSYLPSQGLLNFQNQVDDWLSEVLESIGTKHAQMLNQITFAESVKRVISAAVFPEITLGTIN